MDEDSAATRFNEPEAGPTWRERARLDPLGAVLDPSDQQGTKNQLIDRVHKRVLARAAGSVSGATVLDFGCGTGRLSEWFVNRGASVDGVDVTPEMVAVAAARVPSARFQTIDGITLPFEQAHFDCVVSVAVLQYYVGGDMPMTRELARVLRPGGQLLAIEQVAASELGRGGPIGAYEKMLVGAGLQILDASVVRLGDSRIIALGQRFPRLARLPIVPWLVTTEARARASAPLTEGRYADAFLCATKAAH